MPIAAAIAIADQQADRLLVDRQHLGVVLEREAHRLQSPPDVAGDRVAVATRKARADVDVPRNRLALDHGRGRNDANVRDVTEQHVVAGGRVDQQVAHARQAGADLGRSPDDDLEDLLPLEEASGVDARQQRRGRPADVARFDPALPRLVQVDLDLDRRLFGRSGRPARSPTPSMPATALPHLVRLAAQDRQVLAVDADGDVVLRPAQHLA